MTKGKWLIFISLGIVVAVVVFLLVFFQRGSNAPSDISKDEVTPQKEVETKVREYSDPAGFSFSYPDTLTLEKQEVDETTYSSINLVPGTTAEPITIVVADSEFTSPELWLKKNVSQQDAKTAQKLTLGDMQALQTVTSKGTITVAFDDQVLFKVVAPPNASETTKKAYSTIIASFAFKPPEIQPASGSSNADEDTAVEFEGEEVIE